MQKSLFTLEGKTVLLSGGSGFFGPYFAEALLEAGASLVVVDRDPIPENSIFESAKQKGKIIWYQADLYDDTATRRQYAKIAATHAVDVLINNAFDFSKQTGFNDSLGRLENATRDQIMSSFESGVYWAVRATQMFSAGMKERGSGSIVNVCSMYALVVPAPDLYEGTDKFNPLGYSAAKSALLQFTRYSASFLSPEVRVNAISPGAIPNLETETYNAPKIDDPILDRLNKKILLKRMGHPRDLVGAIVFLASGAASYITGQNIVIDGGLTIT